MINPRRHARLILAAAALAALPASQAAAYQVQSPDAHDANVAAQRQNNVDLRSPDARDAARGIKVGSVAVPRAVATHHDDGTDTGLVIGGLVGGLVLIGTGTGLIVGRHRGSARKAAAA